jgi:hypothetical protein
MPVQGQVALDVGALGQRVPVAPDRVADHPVPDPDRPVGGITLVGAVGGGVGRLQQVGADVGGREVVDGQMPGLQQQQRPGGVDHSDAVQEGPHAARVRLGPDRMIAAGAVPGHDREVAVLQGVGQGAPPVRRCGGLSHSALSWSRSRPCPSVPQPAVYSGCQRSTAVTRGSHHLRHRRTASSTTVLPKLGGLTEPGISFAPPPLEEYAACGRQRASWVWS